MYDDPSPSMLAAIAREVVDRHDAGKNCDWCTPDGCREKRWAVNQLAEHAAARAAFLSSPAPW